MLFHNNLNSQTKTQNKKFNSVVFKPKKLTNLRTELLASLSSVKTTNKTLQNKMGSAVLKTLFQNQTLGAYAPFTKTFMIRGIGFQTDVIDNYANSNEFPYSRYLLLRVGHSFLIYKSIPNYIGVKVSKKDRKLVIYGANKEQVSNFAKEIFKSRPPSIYTGRGIRIKKGSHRRKLGKKDIRKGKV